MDWIKGNWVLIVAVVTVIVRILETIDVVLPTAPKGICQTIIKLLKEFFTIT